MTKKEHVLAIHAAIDVLNTATEAAAADGLSVRFLTNSVDKPAPCAVRSTLSAIVGFWPDGGRILRETKREMTNAVWLAPGYHP